MTRKSINALVRSHNLPAVQSACFKHLALISGGQWSSASLKHLAHFTQLPLTKVAAAVRVLRRKRLVSVKNNIFGTRYYGLASRITKGGGK